MRHVVRSILNYLLTIPLDCDISSAKMAERKDRGFRSMMNGMTREEGRPDSYDGSAGTIWGKKGLAIC